MQSNKKGKGWLRAGLVVMGLLLFVPVLSACSLFGGGDDTPTNEPTTLTIGVMHSYGGDDFQHYRTQYTDLFQITNQHIEIEFVSAIDYSNYDYSYDGTEEPPDPLEEMKNLLQGPNAPDLIFIDFYYLKDLIDENLLQPLDPLLQESGINVDEEFVPAVVEGIRDLGNNQLYALAPTFSSSALIYNKGLFEAAGVELPTDGMTWDEVFDLASRVASGEGEDRVYGFGFERYRYSSPYYSMNMYTAPLEHLKIFDEEAEVMTVDTPEWASVWNTFYDLYDQQIMFNQSREGDMFEFDHSSPFSYDLFMSGKLAMAITHYNELDQLINANNRASNIEGYEFIDWDVVTYPVHAEMPDIGGSVYIEPIMAINAEAQNKEAAWKLIEFIHSEDWAKIKSKSSYNMVSRKDYIEPKQGVDFNISAFYALKPADNSGSYYRGNDSRFWEAESLGYMKFEQVLSGELTVEEALAQWHSEGNEILSRPPSDGDFGIEPLPIEVFEEAVEEVIAD